MSASDQKVAIRVRGVSKSFSLAGAEEVGLAQRVLHPVPRRGEGINRVLEDISFDVLRGEVFGIVGPNGAGKSTLLRLISSIYEPDAGEIEVAGRLAPFIELGIGFQPELSVRHNVSINGVLLGIPNKVLKSRLDAILAFAEIEDFADVQVKNLSSGMRVRLAFAVMLEADAEILILDEILAVGDAAFQQRCREAFQRLRAAGKSIVLVSHRRLEEYCDRALLLEAGRVAAIGEPRDVARRYREIRAGEAGAAESTGLAGAVSAGLREARSMRAEVIELDIDPESGADASNDRRLALRLELDVANRVRRPALELELATAGGTVLFSCVEPLADCEFLRPGQVTLSGSLENRLGPGTYELSCAAVHSPDGGDPVRVSPRRTARFHLGPTGDDSAQGPMALRRQFAVRRAEVGRRSTT